MWQKISLSIYLYQPNTVINVSSLAMPTMTFHMSLTLCFSGGLFFVVLSIWEWQDTWWMTNWKGVGRKWPLPNRVSISKLLWKNWGKQGKPQSWQLVSQLKFELSTSQIQGDWDSVVTHYGLDSLEFESWWRWDIPYLPRLATGDTQPPVQWILCLFSRGRVTEAWCWLLIPF
jgi:hypothetical protein